MKKRHLAEGGAFFMEQAQAVRPHTFEAMRITNRNCFKASLYTVKR
jgi:hypothetical protein